MITTIRVYLILIAFLLVTAGCTGSETGTTSPASTDAPPPSPTEEPTQSEPTTSTPSPTETPRPTESFRLQLSLVNATQTSHGPYQSFELLIRGNTSLPSHDTSSDGDPFFVVRFDGQQITETADISPSPDGQYRVLIPSARLANYAGQDVTINVTLFDKDLTADDRVSSVQTSVSIAESVSTPAPTATPTEIGPTPTEIPNTPETTPTPAQTPIESTYARSAWLRAY